MEPTGAVPMEISLEKYRLAALPAKYQKEGQKEDRRVQPRSYAKIFQGTKLLTGERLPFQRLLNTWHGSNKQSWQLLYRATTNGFSADAFHRACDGHSPTFVIIAGENGHLCGGFTDIPWSKTAASRGRYVSSDKTFLFSLINNEDVQPTKFEVRKRMFAVAHHPDHGPIFGAGADLSISSDCNRNDESYSNLGHSFEAPDGASSSLLMGDYSFSVQDYEVFTIARR